MFDQVELAQFPLSQIWVTKLVQGNLIWLIKEKEVAVVTSPWIKRFQRTRYPRLMGGLSIRRSIGEQHWTMCPDGRGFDTRRLLRPIVGHLLDEEFSYIISSNGEVDYNSPATIKSMPYTSYDIIDWQDNVAGLPRPQIYSFPSNPPLAP